MSPLYRRNQQFARRPLEVLTPYAMKIAHSWTAPRIFGLSGSVVETLNQELIRIAVHLEKHNQHIVLNHLPRTYKQDEFSGRSRTKCGGPPGLTAARAVLVKSACLYPKKTLSHCYRVVLQLSVPPPTSSPMGLRSAI